MDAAPTVHPSERTLRRYALGKLDDVEAAAVEAHLERCGDCRALVAGISTDSFLGQIRDAHRGDAPAPLPPEVAGTLSYSHAAAVGEPARPTLDGLPPGLAGHPDYEIRRELGRGGMGVVYLAHNRLMGRDEVLKVMGEQVVERPDVLDRFLREIRAVARLRHPNIVAAYSAARIGPSIVFAMEYVEGLDLARMVKARGPLPVAHACNFAYQAALGLQHAHEEGLVHRDIKPGNLMLTRRGERATVKVLDFGLAKATRVEQVDAALTREGQALGTPDFIAPEQIVDAMSADVRADIYSLGGTLYYLLTGRPPFRGGSLYDIYQAHLSRDADPLNLVRPEVPSELAALVAKMMAKDPSRRFQTPAEVAEALAPFFKKARPAPGNTGVEVSRPGETVAGRPAARAAGLAPTVADGDWSGLIDFRAPDTLIESAPAAARARRPSSMAPALAVGLMLLGLLAAWLAGVFRVKTPDGWIVIEGAPADAVVSVDGTTVTVEPPGPGKPFTIQAVPGEHRVRVTGDGFGAWGEVVTVTAGESARMKARLKPLAEALVVAEGADAGQTEPAPPAAPPGPAPAITAPVEPPAGPVAVAKGADAVQAAAAPHAPAAADCLQPGSVWLLEPHDGTFIVLERDGERIKARVELGRHVREVNGTVKDGRLRWLGRDVRVIAGNPGNDNEGEIKGDEVAMTWSEPGTSNGGTYKLVIKEHARATAAARPVRPRDARKFRGKYYKAFPQQVSWHEAAARCRELGGHLAVVTGPEENRFLVALLYDRGIGNAWLGATDERDEGRWVWVDGTPMRYSNWDIPNKQPNNKQGIEHYAVLLTRFDGTWCDQPDDGRQEHPGFICQWD